MARAFSHHLLIAPFLFALTVNWHLPGATAATAADQPCNTCIRIRVGLPHVVRGPAADMADNHFTEIQIPGGGFRGFDAHGNTRAIDGRHPWDMGGSERIVLRVGQPGTYDACGQWLNHAELAGTTVLGFIHAETACHYQANF